MSDSINDNVHSNILILDYTSSVEYIVNTSFIKSEDMSKFSYIFIISFKRLNKIIEGFTSLKDNFMQIAEGNNGKADTIFCDILVNSSLKNAMWNPVYYLRPVVAPYKNSDGSPRGWFYNKEKNPVRYTLLGNSFYINKLSNLSYFTISYIATLLTTCENDNVYAIVNKNQTDLMNYMMKSLNRNSFISTYEDDKNVDCGKLKDKIDLMNTHIIDQNTYEKFEKENWKNL